MHFVHIPHSHKAHDGGKHSTNSGSHSAWKNPGPVAAEEKAAHAFAKMLDSITIRPAFVADFFTDMPLVIQEKAFDFVICLLNEWASWYTEGKVTAQHGRMYGIARFANNALSGSPELRR